MSPNLPPLGSRWLLKPGVQSPAGPGVYLVTGYNSSDTFIAVTNAELLVTTRREEWPYSSSWSCDIECWYDCMEPAPTPGE